MGSASAQAYEIERINQVSKRTTKSKSTIYNYIKEGTFPKPIKLGPRSVGWLSHEIDEWITEKIEKRDQIHEQHNTYNRSWFKSRYDFI